MKYNKEFQKPDGRKLMTGGPRDLQRKQRTQDRQQSELINFLRDEVQRLNKELAISGSGEYTGEQVDDEIRKAVSVAVAETKIVFEEERKELQSAVDAFRANEKNLLERIKNLEIYQIGVKDDIDTFRLEKDKAVAEKKEIEDELKDARLGVGGLDDQLKDNRAKRIKAEREVKSLKEKAEQKGTNEEITELLKEQTKQIGALTEALANAEHQLEIETNRPKMETAFIDPLEKDAGKDLTPHIEIKEEKPEEKKGEMNARVEQLRSLMGKFPTVNR